MPTRKFGASQLLLLLTIACMASCALAGLAIGVYDVVYSSANFAIPPLTELSGFR